MAIPSQIRCYYKLFSLLLKHLRPEFYSRTHLKCHEKLYEYRIQGKFEIVLLFLYNILTLK